MKNDVAAYTRYEDPEQLQAEFMRAPDDQIFGNQIANNTTRHVLQRLLAAGATKEQIEWELKRAETVRAVLTDVCLVKGIPVLLLPDDRQLSTIPKV